MGWNGDRGGGSGITSGDGIAADLSDADAPLAREAHAAADHRQRDGTVVGRARLHVDCQPSIPSIPSIPAVPPTPQCPPDTIANKNKVSYWPYKLTGRKKSQKQKKNEIPLNRQRLRCVALDRWRWRGNERLPSTKK